MNIDSPEYKAREKLGRTLIKYKSINPKEKLDLFQPDYVRTCFVVKAAGFDYAQSEYAGFKLLQHRQIKQLNSLTETLDTDVIYHQHMNTIKEVNSLGAKAVLAHFPPPFFSLDERPFQISYVGIVHN